MKIFKLPLILLALSFALTANAVNDTTKLIVLSVNDMHAKIDNFPKFKSLVDSIRSVHKHVLLLSAGDNFTGNPIVDQFPEPGFPIIELMNLTGFNASALGNHEFDYGQDVLAKRLAQSNFPFLSANLSFESAEAPPIKPFVILHLENGIKIGILGLIQINDAGLPDTHPAKLTGVIFNKGIDIAPNYKWLADSTDVLIGLSHLGFEDDVLLAEKMGEFDLITGGHTHTLVADPREYNNVLVMQAGSNLKYVSMTTITLVGNKVIDKQARLLTVSEHKSSDKAMETLIAGFNDNKELNQVIGTVIHPLNGKNELGSLMTDAMTAIAPIEIAFQNNGGIRVDMIPQGNITIKDVYQLDPFGNEIIHFKLSVAEIKSLISNAFNRDKEIDLQVSGINYTVIQDKDGLASDIIITLPDGTSPDENRIFNTGLSSYLASSYDFDHKDEGRSLYTITAQALINFIKANQEINYQGIKRTFVKTAE
jgi:2',3'-cyclic-nucleotide 2'-phosphodiesterase (5'-nucleotidase family)